MGFKKTDYDKMKDFKPGKVGPSSEGDFLKVEFPPAGEFNRYYVRTLPPKESAEHEFPVFDAPVHYWKGYKDPPLPAGVKPGVSPVVFGEEDLASDIFFVLREQYDPDSPEAMAVKNLAPQTRVYINFLIRGVQLWNEKEIGKIPTEEQRPYVHSMTYVEHSNFKSLWEDWLNWGKPLDDFEVGRDLILKVAGGPPKKKTYSASPDSSPIGVDLEVLESRMKDLKQIALKNRLTSEDVEKFIPLILGEFYDKIVEDYRKLKK